MLHVVRSLFFPPLCVHCSGSTVSGDGQLCRPCLSELELADPEKYCTSCFAWLEASGGISPCVDCQKNMPVMDRCAAAFEYEGPASTLARVMKYGNRPYLAETMAAYMVAQWARLDWELPDLIVPVPMMWLRKLKRGYNQSRLLADSISRMINRPVADVLQRKLGGAPQAGLKRSQRRLLPQDLFALWSADRVGDKVILLVDDVCTTTSTLERCAEVLQAAGPRAIHGLTFARAVLRSSKR